MQFIDLKSQQILLKDKINKAIEKVMSHGQFINGPEIEELEKVCANYIGIEHAVGCSSGTDALLLGLMALDIQAGDFIITTPMTFISTAEVISLMGAHPIFVDIDERTFNLDPQKLAQFLEKPVDAKGNGIERERIKGIIGVDMFGQCADYAAIEQLARQHNLFVIEDGAQSFGASLNQQKALSFGDLSTTSFFPAKPLGCYGDGGMVFTRDGHLANKMKQLRNHGQKTRFRYESIGMNGRLDSLQAAILLAKFDTFVNEEISKRQQIANRYKEQLAHIDGLSLPFELPGSKSVWAQFTILTSHQKKLQSFLKERGIPSVVYYPHPLHLEEAFSDLDYQKGDMPVCEEYVTRTLSLPMSAYLAKGDQDKVCQSIIEFFS